MFDNYAVEPTVPELFCCVVCSGNTGNVFQGGRVQEYSVLAVLLPRSGGRETQIWTPGLE